MKHISEDTESPLELQTGHGDWSVPLYEIPWVRGGISTRENGGMSWDSGTEAEVASNRKIYFNFLKLNICSAVAADQVHETRITRVTLSDSGKGMTEPGSRFSRTDALTTDSAGIILTTLHADCAPVFFIHERSRAVGLAHCGWRGTLAGLAGKTLCSMAEEFGGTTRDVRVCIGPTISTGRYEVDRELGERFAGRFGRSVVVSWGGRTYLDLVACLIVDLLHNGLPREGIPVRPPCSFGDTRFASFRRDGPPTRSMLAWLVRTE